MYSLEEYMHSWLISVADSRNIYQQTYMTLLLLDDSKAIHTSKTEKYPESVDVGLNTKYKEIVEIKLTLAKKIHVTS